MKPDAVFSRVAVATSENTSFSVHECNKIYSYSEKIKFSVSFMFLFTKIGFYLLTVCGLVLFNIAFNNFSVILRRCLVATDRELSANF